MSQILSRFIECIVYKKYNYDYKFLCLKRSDDSRVHPGIWQIVTAKIDEGEKAYETARREVVEETGLQPAELFIAPAVNQFYNHMDDSVNFIPVFIARVNSEDVKISHEHSAFKWLSIEDMIGRVHWANQKKILQDAYDHLKYEDLFKTLKKIT